MSPNTAIVVGIQWASCISCACSPTMTSKRPPIGALVGETVLRGARAHTLAGVLAFGAAALLYLITEELLVEAHETRDTTAGTAMFFARSLLFLLLGMAA